MKKRDKKSFKREDINISNIGIKQIDDFIEDEIVLQRKAEKKPSAKGILSRKTNLQLVRGRVLELYSNYKCLVKIGEEKIECQVGGWLKQYNLETRNILAPGDWVKVELAENSRIEEIEERRNTLNRFTEDSYQKKIVVASNLDNVVILSSCLQPGLNLGLVDRLICAALLSDITPVICISKSDLAKDLPAIKAETDFYRQQGYRVIYCSAVDKTGLDELREVLQNQDSVFMGHSGVGKSSLINALQPGLNLKEGEVSEYTGKGMHTTSRSRIIAWDFGGNLIDTPGIKTLTLHEENKNEIKYVFPGMLKLSQGCFYPNCTHTHETDCGVKNAVARGEYDLRRYESYCRLLSSFTGVVYE